MYILMYYSCIIYIFVMKCLQINNTVCDETIKYWALHIGPLLPSFLTIVTIAIVTEMHIASKLISTTTLSLSYSLPLSVYVCLLLSAIFRPVFSVSTLLTPFTEFVYPLNLAPSDTPTPLHSATKNPTTGQTIRHTVRVFVQRRRRRQPQPLWQRPRTQSQSLS